MSSNNEKEILFKIQYAKDTLARITAFIVNCDTKSGMMLAISGVISIILANNGILVKINLMTIAAFNAYNLLAIFFVIVLLFCALCFLYGMFKLTNAISANLISNSSKSRTFFADIAKYTLLNYKQEFINHTEEYILDDLLNQIHVNAKICSMKFKYYNQGLRMIRCAAAVFICAISFGFSVFYF